MIVLDTHIWIWWVHGDTQLPPDFRASIDAQPEIGVCAISCWEVAKLVEGRRIHLPGSIDQWLRLALSYPAVILLPLSPEVSVESTRLPGVFHRDPADQMIVATARVYDCPLLTVDRKISAYPHVRLGP
jgi:PIN domain nuclease of toxin-antitoxin system